MTNHGYNAYSNGCRCDECKAAKATYMREKRKANRQYAGQLISPRGRYVAPIQTHGTIQGYQDHKCRCLQCTAARASADRRQRLGADEWETYERKNAAANLAYAVMPISNAGVSGGAECAAGCGRRAWSKNGVCRKCSTGMQK